MIVQNQNFATTDAQQVVARRCSDEKADLSPWLFDPDFGPCGSRFYCLEEIGLSSQSFLFCEII